MNKIFKIINEEIKNLRREDYLKWKRNNVTYRGIKDRFNKNDGNGNIGLFGNGLYTAYLSNKSMAKQYGELYYVVGAIPKNPYKVKSVNDAEIFFQNLVMRYGKANGIDDYFEAKRMFEENTNIETEMIKLGYDGFAIVGREMVNYKPDNDNIRYFQNDRQLEDYYFNILN